MVWICPLTEMGICRRASKDQHAVHLREFAGTYVRVELHQISTHERVMARHRAGMSRDVSAHPWSYTEALQIVFRSFAAQAILHANAPMCNFA
jgi:hypothetical protein